jgi:hypothetical protein
MGRKPGSKNKPKQDGDAKAAEPSMGHNGGPKVELTEEQRQALFFNQHLPKYKAALAQKKAADKHLKDVAKLARADLGENAVADIKLAIEAETPEGEAAIKARMESQARLLRWLGLPVGEQGTLFPTDLTPAVDKARADGKRAGFKGETCSPPHDPSVPQHAAWIEGWHDGQAVLVQTKLRPMPVQEQPKTAGDAGAPADGDEWDKNDVRPRAVLNDQGDASPAA